MFAATQRGHHVRKILESHFRTLNSQLYTHKYHNDSHKKYK